MTMNIDGLFENLGPEQARILREQIERFKFFNGQDIKNVNVTEGIALPVGTLIHGTSCTPQVLSSISETGIITGQAFGIEEDGETYFCADFHRIDKFQTLEKYNKEFPYIDGRCPFGTRGKRQIAFIIYPDERLKEIIDHDCYRENGQASFDTKKFVNMQGLPIDDQEKAASILFGIPRCFISGIVLGDDCITEEILEFITRKFPGAFITRNTGEIIYKHGDTKEMMDLRLEKVKLSIKNGMALKKIDMLSRELDRTKAEKNQMWDAIADYQ